MAKVFIGMPVYNGEATMRKAIDTLLAQTFQDFTIFISDNASTDNTPQIIADYTSKDPRITSYRQQENLGMFGNFKYVMDQADAPYFMWAAHDDLWEQNFLEVCVEALDKDPALGLAATVGTLIDIYGRFIADMPEMTDFADRSIPMQVVRYTLQAEGLGKVNVLYGLWRTEAVHTTWQAYPQRAVWGHDNHFILAGVSRYRVHVDPRALFSKNPTLATGEKHPPFEDPVKTRTYADRNNPFPYKHFTRYFKGHMEALRGTPYRPLVAVLLLLRLPRSFYLYAKERNYRKFFKKVFLAREGAEQ